MLFCPEIPNKAFKDLTLEKIMKYNEKIEELRQEKIEILKLLLNEERKSFDDFENDKPGLFLLKLGTDLIKCKFGYGNEKEFDLKKGDICFVKPEEKTLINFEYVITKSSKFFKLNEEFLLKLKNEFADRDFCKLTESEKLKFRDSKRLIQLLVINTNSLTSYHLSDEEVETLLKSEKIIDEKVVSELGNSFDVIKYLSQETRTLETYIFERIMVLAKIVLRETIKTEEYLEDFVSLGQEKFREIILIFDITANKSLESHLDFRLKKSFLNELKRLTGYKTEKDIENKAPKYTLQKKNIPLEQERDGSDYSVGKSRNLQDLLAINNSPEKKLERDSLSKDLKKAINSLKPKYKYAIDIYLDSKDKSSLKSEKEDDFNYRKAVEIIHRESKQEFLKKIENQKNKEEITEILDEYLEFREIESLNKRNKITDESVTNRKNSLKNELFNLEIDQDLLDKLAINESTLKSQIRRAKEQISGKLKEKGWDDLAGLNENKEPTLSI